MILRALLAAVLLAAPLCAAIKQAPADDGKIPDLRPPRAELPVERAVPRRAWPWALAAGVLTLSFITLLVARRPQPAPPEQPYSRAVRELQALPEDAGADAVVAIFRRYAGTALGFPGEAQTPDELVSILAQQSRWTAIHTARFRRLFDPVELAKFAPAIPAPPGNAIVNEAQQLIATIEEFRRGVLGPVPA